MNLVNLPIERWFKAIQIRRSRRTFIDKSIDLTLIDNINQHVAQLNTLNEGVRLILIEHPPDKLFISAKGPYGKITGAPAYIAVVADLNKKYSFEFAGYIGEAILLEVTALGLSSCWIGGSFKAEEASLQVDVLKGEKIVAVLPIGYARKNYSLTEKMMQQSKEFHKRKSVSDLVEGLTLEKWPTWIEKAIQAAQLAPSAYNRQSVRYVIGEDHSILIHISNPTEETKVPKQIDCGIAMLHIQLATSFLEVQGDWQFLELPNVAKFVPR